MLVDGDRHCIMWSRAVLQRSCDCGVCEIVSDHFISFERRTIGIPLGQASTPGPR